MRNQSHLWSAWNREESQQVGLQFITPTKFKRNVKSSERKSIPMVAVIRKLSVEYVDALIEVARESWKWTYAGIYSDEYIERWIREKYSREKLLNEITRSRSESDLLFLGAFVDLKLSGFMEVKIKKYNAELLRLYLKPEYTHMKIGRDLLSEAEKVMKERGVSECTLYVHSQNQVGISFYLKNGFTVKGINGNDFLMVKKYE